MEPFVVGSPDINPSFIDSFGNKRAQTFVKQPIMASLPYSNYKPSIELRQTLSQPNDSVLATTISSKYLFSGAQSGVWCLSTFLLVKTLIGHSRSVLCLALSDDEKLLFSGSDDDTIHVWDVLKLELNYVIRTPPNVGDILSLAYFDNLKTVYLGCQDTSIQWYHIEDENKEIPDESVFVLEQTVESNETELENLSLFHKLVDKIPGLPPQKAFFEPTIDSGHNYIKDTCVQRNSHHGYIYSLFIGTIPDDCTNQYLFSGSGDGDIKVWKINLDASLSLYEVLPCNEIATVYTMVIRDGLLFAGLQGGLVAVWDLETNQRIRNLMGHQDDILALTCHNGDIYSGCGEGVIKKWNRSFECELSLKAHDGLILCLSLTNADLLVSGSNDTLIKFWYLPPNHHHLMESEKRFLQFPSPSLNQNTTIRGYDIPINQNIDDIIYVLDKWIRIPTISGQSAHQEDCRLGAKLLKNLLIQLGASQSKLVQSKEGRNPLVYGTFKAVNCTQKRPKHILFYGHYDVVSARSKDWFSNPFQLMGRDGYLYGRGVTDNKGPILAAVFATSELLREKNLLVDVTFVIEGEEESGSAGFYPAITELKPVIGEVDLILLSNSYWLGENIPCITYGLRGVIHASIKVSNDSADSHSGVYGGAVVEPLIDLTHTLAQLIDFNKKVTIPDFYANVRPVSDKELEEFEDLVARLETTQAAPSSTSAKLQAQWRHPTFTVHKISTSGPSDHSTVIPSSVRADVSMRIVPDQSLKVIANSFQSYVAELFNNLNSENKLEVTVRQTADWWLGQPDNAYYTLLKEVLSEAWGVNPLPIREGGSIPTVPWLEKFFDAPAVHLPLGQSTDQAHLANERLRVKNLTIGKSVLKKYLTKLATL